ncbi:MAG TPA: MOSC N-terminal beta barrel domain-containing protein [Jatrophihabitans sp.]
MRVAELWRYPVKSLQGERVSSALLTARGIEGDRGHAIFDVETGFGLTARRAPQLLSASAALGSDGVVRIVLPDGSLADDDAALSDWLGRPVQLRSCDEVVARRYEDVADVETEAPDSWSPFSGAGGAFHDSDRANVSMLSLASVGGWNPRRFRANLLLEGDGEDELVGSEVQIGSGRMTVIKPIDRCVMTTRPQPGGIEKDLDVLRTIRRERMGKLAVGCVVTAPGRLQVGDEVRPAS